MLVADLCKPRPRLWTLTVLLVDRLVGGAGRIASQHLFVLAHSNTLALHHLQVLETTQHLVVDLECCLDPEGGTLLDGEGLVLEVIHSPGGGQVDHDIGTVLDNQGQGLDHTLGIVGLADGVARVQAQRGLPAVQSFIVLVCTMELC